MGRTLILVGVFLLSACADNIQERHPLSSDYQNNILVQNITVDLLVSEDVEDAPDNLPDILEGELRYQSQAQARGEVPVDMHVTVTQFRYANAALTILIGDSNSLRGTVYLKDARTGEGLAEYDVVDISPSSGLLGVAIDAASDIEGNLSENFAETIVRRIYGEGYVSPRTGEVVGLREDEIAERDRRTNGDASGVEPYNPQEQQVAVVTPIDQAVLADINNHIEDHRNSIQTELSAYNREHEIVVEQSTGVITEVKHLHGWEVLEAQNDTYVVAFQVEVGRFTYLTVHGRMILEVKKTNTGIEILGQWTESS